MITKKDWDLLPLTTKRTILSTLYGDNFEQRYSTRQLLYAYHHNFDFDDTGKLLKSTLQQIYRVNDGELYVKVTVKYVCTSAQAKFLASHVVEKKRNTSSKASSASSSGTNGTCRWYCDYISKTDGDVAHVWCEAETRAEAESYFKSEDWDIEEILSIHK